jgi:hypothetical protein
MDKRLTLVIWYNVLRSSYIYVVVILLLFYVALVSFNVHSVSKYIMYPKLICVCKEPVKLEECQYSKYYLKLVIS